MGEEIMKFKKTLLVFCLIICVLFCVSSVAAGDVNETAIASENQDSVDANVATTEVDNEKIESDVISSSNEEILNTKDNGTFTALQNKINSASAGSTITLENDYVYDEGFDTGGIIISKSLTIMGNGKTIDGAETSRIFHLSARTVFIDVNFINGYAYGDDNHKWGGAIDANYYGDDSNAISYAINCTFVNNAAEWYGGALYRVSANNCTFIDNTAAYEGGAISGGSAFYSTFKNCSAMDGGAIFSKNGNVSNCNFISCNGYSVIYYGSISNSIFKNCSGSGVHSGDVINSTFINCEHAFWGQRKNKAENCTFIDCGDKTTHGGIVKYCIFKGNSKPSSDSNVYRHCKIDIVQSGNCFKDTTLTVKVIDIDSNIALENIDIKLNFNNGKNVRLTTDSKGSAIFEIPFSSGKYSVTASINDEKLDCQKAVLNNIIINKAPSKLSSAKINTVYKVKKALNVKLVYSKNNKGLSGIKIIVKIYTGKKYIKHTLTTNSNGIASLNVNGLSVGNHKVVISCSDSSVSAKSITTSVNVKKANPVLSTYNFIISKGFFVPLHGKGIILKDKTTKKPLVGVKVKFKLYTSSKKYKTFSLLTDNNGKCALFTNKYSAGNHKLLISVSDSVLKLKSKTITYNIRSDEKFKLNNAYFNVLYTNGIMKIS